MADEVATPPAEAPATEPQAPEPQQTPDVPPEVKAALRKANKEAETLRLRLKEFEDRDKTEQQKLAERAEAAEKQAEMAQAQLLRFEIAATKGLTPGQARRLVGSTREELEADADELLADLGKARPTGIDQGPRGSTKASPADEFARILQSRMT